MRNPRHQTPKPKEAPGSKHQAKSVSYISNNPWDDNGAALVLRDKPHSGYRHPFDLEERTARFGEAIVRFSKKIPRNSSNNRLIDQIAGAGTSVGANYCEADERVSKKAFKVSDRSLCQGSKRDDVFSSLIATAEPNLAAEARVLYREAKELMLIFASIYKKMNVTCDTLGRAPIGTWCWVFLWGLGFGAW